MKMKWNSLWTRLYVFDFAPPPPKKKKNAHYAAGMGELAYYVKNPQNIITTGTLVLILPQRFYEDKRITI